MVQLDVHVFRFDVKSAPEVHELQVMFDEFVHEAHYDEHYEQVVEDEL